MKPILFDKTATIFTSNGLGRLDLISCIVTEERNGIFELEAEIAESALHADQIEMNSIIGASAYKGGNIQAFRVYQITKPMGGRFKVYAEHISYQLSMIPCMPFEVAASSTACADTLTAFRNNAVVSCPFRFGTDVVTVAGYKQTLPASIRSRMGGVEGSVIDQFGGEWEYDNYNVYLRNHRGVTTPTVTLRYGKNITDLTQEENIASTITGIVPYWASSEGDDTLYLPEKIIESSHAAAYPFKRIIPYDFSSSFEEKPTEAQLRARAQAYVNQSGVGVPVVSIEVSFIDLASTEEYKDVAALQNVRLCDYVNVEFAKYGISTNSQVVKCEYDVLAERYNSIELGSIRSNLATTITDMNNSNMTSVTNKFSQLSNELQESIDNATAWLTSDGGVIRALKNTAGEWTDLLCMSATATATSGNVLRLNVNGIGFSSTGWNGTFTQAWTLDGRIVIGGTNVPSITVYDSNNKIIFQADANKIIWNATNSSMDSSGVITATGAQLTNADVFNNLWIKTLNNQSVHIHGGQIDFVDPDNNTTTLSLYDGTITSDKLKLTTVNASKYIDLTTGNNSALDIYTNGSDITINASGSGSDINMYGEDINMHGDVIIAGMLDMQSNIIKGDDPDSSYLTPPQIRFSDTMDSDTGHLTLSAPNYVILESSDVVVGNNGDYSKGYTGSFTVRTTSGTATMAFKNGILVQ